MAEIRVQERRGNPLWVWVLILLVVIAALTWFFTRDGGDAVTTPADTVGSVIAPTAPAAPRARARVA